MKNNDPSPHGELLKNMHVKVDGHPLSLQHELMFVKGSDALNCYRRW